jgi:hypothetical protein
MTTYTWLTGGGTVGFPLPNVATNVNIALPANATLKRFQLRKCSIQGFSHGTGFQYIQPLAMAQIVQFTSGFYSGKVIYQSYKDVPYNHTIFVPITGDNAYAMYHAGDREMGFNERCSYGGAGKAASNLQFQWYPISPPGYPNVYAVGMNYQFAALYSV